MILYMLFNDKSINDTKITTNRRGISNILTVGGNHLKGYLGINDKQLANILNKFNAINLCDFYFDHNIGIETIKSKTILNKYKNIPLELIYSDGTNNNFNIKGYVLCHNRNTALIPFLYEDLITYDDMKILMNDIKTNFYNEYHTFEEHIIFDNEENKNKMQRYILELKNQQKE